MLMSISLRRPFTINRVAQVMGAYAASFYDVLEDQLRIENGNKFRTL